MKELAPALKDKDCKVTKLHLENLTPDAMKVAEEILQRINHTRKTIISPMNRVPVQRPVLQQPQSQIRPVLRGGVLPTNQPTLSTAPSSFLNNLSQSGKKRKGPPPHLDTHPLDTTPDVTFVAGSLPFSQLLNPEEPNKKIKEEPISPPSSPKSK